MRLWRIRPACVGYRCAIRRRCLSLAAFACMMPRCYLFFLEKVQISEYPFKSNIALSPDS